MKKQYYLIFYIKNDVPHFISSNGIDHNYMDYRKNDLISCYDKINYGKIYKIVDNYFDFIHDEKFIGNEIKIPYGYVSLNDETIDSFDLLFNDDNIIGKTCGVATITKKSIIYENCYYDINIGKFDMKGLMRHINLKNLLND